MIKKLAIVLLVLCWTGSAFGGNIEVDPQLSNYSKQGGVKGVFIYFSPARRDKFLAHVTSSHLT